MGNHEDKKKNLTKMQLIRNLSLKSNVVDKVVLHSVKIIKKKQVDVIKKRKIENLMICVKEKKKIKKILMLNIKKKVMTVKLSEKDMKTNKMKQKISQKE